MPNDLEFLFREDFITSNHEFPLILIIATLYGLLIRFFYLKYSRTISEKKSFSNNFAALIIIVTLIITIIKSSLALSLGLIGALSIVRYRTAIKNPEDLIFLFLCISIGVGLGAGKIFLVSIALFIFLVIYAILNYSKNINNITGSAKMSIYYKKKQDLEKIIKSLNSLPVKFYLSEINNGTENNYINIYIDTKDLSVDNIISQINSVVDVEINISEPSYND
tara:strand:- start:189 stop:854 length:666 start_codon:yes stop_codon:yes gene_type:complete